MDSFPRTKTRAMAGWILVVILGLTSLSCRAAMGSPGPGVTPTVVETSSLADEVTPTSSLTDEGTPGSTPAETPTPVPPGTVVNVTGVVQEIRVENNITIIVVNGVEFRVPPEILVIIIQHLHVGTPIVFVGRADVTGVIIIINVIKIDNVTIVINPPEKHGGEDEDEDEDD